MLKLAAWLLVLSMAACKSASEETSDVIARSFESSGKKAVDLSSAVTEPWDKVCILGPYTDNEAAEKTLGFKWDVEANSSIMSNDSISLLIFVRGAEVVRYVEHRRHLGDFSNSSMKCFAREKAMFIHNPKPTVGWPGLFANDGA
jgi:hypothetical protein